jgi:uncharacterized protein
MEDECMPKTEIDIKKQSPLDSLEVAPLDLVQIKPAAEKSQWVPSRYNLRTTGDDGRYILWNSYTGAISIFNPQQKQAIQRILKSGYEGEARGVIKYLTDRGFLVPKGTNEFRQIQLGFGQMHYRNDVLDLILLASEDCNFRCSYCYEEFKRGTMLPSVREGIKKLIEKRAPNLRHLTIGWFGGEPLYGFKAIEDLGPFFAEITSRYSIQFVSHMTTNAYLLTPDVAEKLLAWKVFFYQVTLDGMRAQHDKKRPARDGSGTFDTIISNLRALKQREEKFRVRLRVNYDYENYPHLEELLSLLEDTFEHDPRFIVAFHAVGKWGGANDENLTVCPLDEGKAMRERLRHLAISKGLGTPGTLRDMNGAGKNVCYAARPYNFTIAADGKVMKCTVALDKHDYNIVGQVTPDGEFNLNVENLARWVEPSFESDPVCQKCVLLSTCQGIACPLARIQTNTRPCASTPKTRLRNELLLVLKTADFNSREIRISNAE